MLGISKTCTTKPRPWRRSCCLRPALSRELQDQAKVNRAQLEKVRVAALVVRKGGPVLKPDLMGAHPPKIDSLGRTPQSGTLIPLPSLSRGWQSDGCQTAIDITDSLFDDSFLLPRLQPSRSRGTGPAQPERPELQTPRMTYHAPHSFPPREAALVAIRD